MGGTRGARSLLGNESVSEDCFQATLKMMVRGRGDGTQIGVEVMYVASSHNDDDGDGNGDSESL